MISKVVPKIWARTNSAILNCCSIEVESSQENEGRMVFDLSDRGEACGSCLISVAEEQGTCRVERGRRDKCCENGRATKTAPVLGRPAGVSDDPGSQLEIRLEVKDAGG